MLTGWYIGTATCAYKNAICSVCMQVIVYYVCLCTSLNPSADSG